MAYMPGVNPASTVSDPTGQNYYESLAAQKLNDQAQSAIGSLAGYSKPVSRIAVTREDLIEVALKLQEAASLITQALSRLGGR